MFTFKGAVLLQSPRKYTLRRQQLFVSKTPDERGTSERGFLTQTTSAYIPVQRTLYVVSCLLHVRREFSLKQFSERKVETITKFNNKVRFA